MVVEGLERLGWLPVRANSRGIRSPSFVTRGCLIDPHHSRAERSREDTPVRTRRVGCDRRAGAMGPAISAVEPEHPPDRTVAAACPWRAVRTEYQGRHTSDSRHAEVGVTMCRRTGTPRCMFPPTSSRRARRQFSRGRMVLNIGRPSLYFFPGNAVIFEKTVAHVQPGVV